MNIYVGNLSLNITSEELQKEFGTFGTVTSVVIMNDRYIGSGQTRGYGFVEMVSKLEGYIAIKSLHGKKLKGQIINVMEALPLSDKGNTGSHRSYANKRFNRNADRSRY